MMLALIDFKLELELKDSTQRYFEITSTAIMLHTSGILSLIPTAQSACWDL